MRIRLQREALFAASTTGLERLATFLGLALPIRSRFTERAYRAKLVQRIQRAEKLLARAPKEST